MNYNMPELIMMGFLECLRSRNRPQTVYWRFDGLSFSSQPYSMAINSNKTKKSCIVPLLRQYIHMMVGIFLSLAQTFSPFSLDQFCVFCLLLSAEKKKQQHMCTIQAKATTWVHVI